MKKYIAVKNPGDYATHICVELRYNIGGQNCFTYEPIQRGYYLHVTPVKREDRDGYIMESFTAFTGTKYCVKPVSRKSAKAEKEAETAAAQIENTLVKWICDKNGLEV